MEKKVLNHGSIALVEYLGSDAEIVKAARASYQQGTKQTQSDRSLLRYLMRHQHYSPFAMAVVKFHIKMPLAINVQALRHDRFHWNLWSGRYSEMQIEKWLPEGAKFIRLQSTTNKQSSNGSLADTNPEDAEHALRLMAYVNGITHDVYTQLLELGVPREQARMILPMSQYTEGYVIANLGDWMLFLKQRMQSGAQEEIRVYAQAIFEILSEIYPEAMKAFEDYQLHAVTFSRMEMNILRALLNGYLGIDSTSDTPTEEFETWEQVAVDVKGVSGKNVWARAHTIFNMEPKTRAEFLEQFGLDNKRERIEFFQKVNCRFAKDK